MAKCKPSECCAPAKKAADTAAADDSLAALAWAVAHPVRVKLLRILTARESCVCGELVVEFDLAQSTISQHLKILREAGLIQGEIDGPKVCYCVDPDGLARLKKLVAGL
ncbi:MAG TPA: metalloregulator ArsR/SmtB family transcription factor [Gemmataceae bacterium]|nr:metalloregulator ArsR/SmtB family transcription factor [Gemmataceae bacterium]